MISAMILSLTISLLVPDGWKASVPLSTRSGVGRVRTKSRLTLKTKSLPVNI